MVGGALVCHFQFAVIPNGCQLLLHSEGPKLSRVLAFQSAIGLKVDPFYGGAMWPKKANRMSKMWFPYEKMAEKH